MGLDTVEIVISLEECFGIQIEDATAAELISIQDAIDHICAELNATDAPSFCPPRRALLRVHEALHEAGVPRDRKIRVNDRLQDLRGSESKKNFLRRFDAAIGIRGFKTYYGILTGFPTVKTCVREILSRDMKGLKRKEEPWTRSLVRCGVRAVVADVSGLHDFQDSDRFVVELRLD